jgi:peptide/nickel transport system permease protein
MARFIVRRLIGMVFVLFAVSVIVFFIFNVIPADPAQRIAGKNATPQLVENVTKELGLDKSLPVQYGTMMKKIFTGELISYSSRLNVDEQIKQRIPATLSLSIGAAILWMFFGVLFGYLAAVKANSLTDRALTIFSIAGISMPVFLLADIFLYFLGHKFEVFPEGGYVTLAESPNEWLSHLILPWVTLAILYAGFYSRVLRSSMLEVTNEDYVRTARAKGLSLRRVRTRHILRNSLIPIVTLFGLDFGAVIGGAAILVEKIFSINGVGFYAVEEGIGKEDFPVIMAVTILGAFFVVLFNAVVDITYAYLDPRIRLGTSAQ